MNLIVWDWIIIVAYLAMILSLGFFVNRFTGKIDNYLVAGRSVRTGLLIATFIGTELGLVTIVYAAQMGFVSGLAGLHIPVLAMLICMFIGVTGLVVYRLRAAGVMTIPEYYEQRYGRKTRVFGGMILVLAGILNMGMFLRAGAEFIGGLAGLESGLYIKLIMTALLGIVLAYTILGGMISVIITDYAQFALLGLGFLLVTCLCLTDVGWDGAVRAVAEHATRQQQTEIDARTEAPDASVGSENNAGRPDPRTAFDPLASPVFGWTYIIWMCMVLFSGAALWQPVTIRALVAADPSTAKNAYFWSAIGYLVRFAIPCFWGACALAFVIRTGQYDRFFSDGAGNASVSTLGATGIYLGALLPPVVIGLVAAALLASFMSTHDSYLMAWSSSIVQDVIAPLRRHKPLSEKARIRLTRIFIFLIGCFLLIWGLWYEVDGHLWDYMAITGTVYFAGAFAVVVGGLYWKRAGSTGAVLAMSAGLLALVGILPRARIAAALERTIELSGPTGAMIFRTCNDFIQWRIWEPRLLGLTVFISAIAAMILGSLLFPDRRPNINGVQ